MGITVGVPEKVRFQQLGTHGIAVHGNKRTRCPTALIVDEAQNLDWNVLEEIRLLGNLENRRGKLLQIILSGQPDSDESDQALRHGFDLKRIHPQHQRFQFVDRSFYSLTEIV